MEHEPEISYRNFEPSPSIEDAINSRIKKLEKYSKRIIRCRVMVEAAARNKQKGNLYHLRISLDLPGEDIDVTRDPKMNQKHENIFITIADAFDAAERQLRDLEEKVRGDVKAHTRGEPAL